MTSRPFFIHRMTAGDLAAFAAVTGTSHCLINNSAADVRLLVRGEAAKPGSRLLYPLNPSRRADIPPGHWWDDVPARPRGPHDAMPD